MTHKDSTTRQGIHPASIGIYEKALPTAMTWPERLAAAADAGFDAIEISIDEDDLRLQRLDWDYRQRADLRNEALRVGVPIASMCLSALRRYPLGSKQAGLRQKALHITAQAIDLVGDLGARIVLLPGYDVFYEASDDETRVLFLDGLHQALARASQAGVMLALENVDRSVTSIVQALWYVQQLNSPWLQLYGDIGNLNALGCDVLAELEAGAGYLAALHVKDTVAGEFRHVPFGQGTVPFALVFRKLKEIGFCGPIVLELWSGDDPGALQTAFEARRWIQACMDAA